MADLPLSFEDWEKRAQEKLSRERFAYISAGAGGGEAVRGNNEELRRWKLVPRALRDTKERTTSTEVLGVKMAVPVALAPVRGLNYFWERGEEACARAASGGAVPLVLSNLASASPETVAGLMGTTPHFFQLYPCTDGEIEDSFIRRAEAGGYAGIFMTVDMPAGAVQYSGPKTAEYEQYGNEVYLSDPVFQSRLKEAPARDRNGAIDLIRRLRKACFTWEDVETVSKRTGLPVVLKGILGPEDAAEAVERGAKGVVVSNHGGRSLDGAISPANMLSEIRGEVGNKLAVFLDGGIRSGSDVLRSLALGADAALVGRAYAYALAVAGEAGVTAMLRNMIREIDYGMSACGCRSVRELNQSYLRRQ